MGEMGPVALNMLAIDKAMDYYKIDDDERVDFSVTVRKIASVVFSAQAKELAEKIKASRKGKK